MGEESDTDFLQEGQKHGTYIHTVCGCKKTFLEPDQHLEECNQIVDLDLKRNRNREALNALQKDTDSGKVKVCFGNMFIQFPKPKAKAMIQKDQEQLDKEINDLRKGLKAKVNHLNEIQGKPELRGCNLSPLSGDEIKAINSLLKR